MDLHRSGEEALMNRIDGITLLRERVAYSRERLRALWSSELPVAAKVPFPWVVTGLGSSEAHARYLVELANQFRPGSAVFWPTTAFALSRLPKQSSEASLIVFSQGLSANARIALEQRGAFRSGVLFTAATPENLRTSGKQSAALLYEDLAKEGWQIVATPEPDEYTILLRVIGPLCGYFSALQWFQQQTDNSIPPLSEAELAALFNLPDEIPDEWVDDFREGVEFNYASTVGSYAQNLGYKRVEGLFLSEPVHRELLQFSHGPFQQNMASSAPQWIFAEADETTKSLVEQVWPLYIRLAATPRLIESPVPAPYSIFYYEMLLNEILLSAIETCPHCQINWPGKGLDGEGYSIEKPV
jgi:creatinine amidohydrolase